MTYTFQFRLVALAGLVSQQQDVSRPRLSGAVDMT